ncbi:MAG: PIN domain-containing protein, partial [Acidimicrobiales bacterium]|nr:PIN domain-containing protein [Acidimicrobiales bacterium]
SRAESCGGPTDSREFRESLDVDVKEAFAHRVLSVDAPVATMASSLHVPDPAPINDAYIAATALVHGLATRLAG